MVTVLTPQQWLGGLVEVETATMLLRAGVAELSSIGPTNRFTRLPLGLVAQGLERLSKLTIALVLLQDTGSLPSSVEMKRRYGHDLLRLLDEVAEIASRPAYRFPAARGDGEFLAGDAFLRDLLHVISMYGDQSRYFNLDALLDDAMPAVPDPDAAFSAFELKALQRDPDWETRVALPPDQFNPFYPKLNAEMTAAILRYARAMGRLFIGGPAGDPGRRMSGHLFPLLSLRDDALTVLPEKWSR